MPSAYTAAMKLAAVEREIGYRKHVYPRLIEQKKMTAEAAAKQVAIFEAIAADYRQAAEKERLF